MRIKLQEKEQGRRIQCCAGKIWGWATPAGKLRVKRRIDEFLPYLGPAKGKIVLEIGCGTGIFTRLFRQNGILPVALDISYDLLRRAKQDNPGINFVQADAENIPFKKNTFDFVLGVSVLHHLDLETALRNIRMVLKGGGMMLFSEPNMANPQIFLQKRIGWIKRLLHDTPGEAAFLRWSLEKILIKNGFSCVRIRPFDFLHPYTPVSLISLINKLGRALERIWAIKEISGSLLVTGMKPEP